MNNLSREISIVPRKSALLFIDVQNYNARSDGGDTLSACHDPMVKDYSPYLDSICPKITCELLLSQRALLYLGAKQAGKESNFEDMVLDSSHYHARCTENGCVELSQYKESQNTDDVDFNNNQSQDNLDSPNETNNQNAVIKDYSGLQAMLANRMKYQRGFHGYDIFISTHDLNMSGEEFVGLARRYLAAAERLSD